MPGKVIQLPASRRYVIEREIGQGGMGVVYQARDLERNTRVALKALTQTDAVNIYRLKNEFRQLADLSHPNLVSLHELCYDGDKWFFTMELVDGQTFDEYVALDRQSAPSVPEQHASLSTIAGRARLVRDVTVTLNQRAIGGEYPLQHISCDLNKLRSAIRQLAAAIAALHEAGKLHRDIKPSNVLVTRDGRVVVLDFGLVSNSTHVDAEAQDAERTIGGCVFGTPAYMSPEQAAGEPVTTASDWYSVGAVLYEALTGQLPFDGTVLQILKQKDELEPLPPSDVVSGVPTDLDALCRGLLRRRPEDRPNAHEILRQLASKSEPAPAYDANPSVGTDKRGDLFVGREPHLAQLSAAFARVREGSPATVFVHGYSGMGKSALVRCFANEIIKREEAVVLRGRCYERESVPYKAFDDIIDALSRYMMRLPTDEATELLPRNIHALARLFPVLKRVKAVAHARVPMHASHDVRELRNQAFGALKELLLRLSDWHPLIINIDDLQWGDMDSARLLSHILGAPDAPPILFVGAYRREEATTSPFLRHVLGESVIGTAAAAFEAIAVDPLSPAETDRLTRELLRDHPTANAMFTSSIAAESDGVPFFIGELAQHVRAQAHKMPTKLESISLDNVITARVADMSADAQVLLEVLSVAARPIEQGVALEAAGLPTGDRAALLALRAARLIRTRGTRQTDFAETYHDRVRETVVLHMSTDRARDVHAKIARASEVWGVGEPEQLVVHYAEAGEGVRAGETAIHAARTAGEKLAFNRAADLYRKAIELIGAQDKARQRDLYEHLGDAYANAGRGAQAAEAYLQAAEGADPSQSNALRRRAAQQLLRSGRAEQGTAIIRKQMRELSMEYPESTGKALALLLWNRSLVRMFPSRLKPAANDTMHVVERERLELLGCTFRETCVIDPLRGTVLQLQYLRAAMRSSDPMHLLNGLVWEIYNSAMGDGIAGAPRVETLLATARELAERVATPYAQALVAMIEGACALCYARFPEAIGHCAKAEALFRDRCPGTSWERSITTTIRYAGIELAGDLNVLAHEAHEQVREARERDDRFGKNVLALTAPMAYLMWDDPDSSLSLLHEQSAELEPGFTTSHLWVMDRMADTYLYQERYDLAFQYLESQWPAFQASFLPRAELLAVNAHFLRGRVAVAAATVCDATPRRAIATKHVKALRKLQRPDAQVYASLLEAGLAHQAGDRFATVAALSHARDTSLTHGYENYALYSAWNLGLVSGDGVQTLLRREAGKKLLARGVVSPQRWVNTYSPGFTLR